MSTNNTFSFDGFGKYFRLYMTQNGHFFVQFILAAYVIFSLLFIVISSIQYSSISPELSGKLAASEISSMTSGICLMAGLPLMCIVASHMMHTIQNRRTRLHTLTLPASSLEKYLSYWLVHVFFFFIAYFCIIVAADATRTGVCRLFYPDYIEYINFTQTTLTQPIAPKDYLVTAMIPLLFVQSYFVLGSTIWNRYSFFKTLGFGILGVFIIIFTLNIIAHKARIGLYAHVIPNYTTYLALIPTLFNWYMGYRRFKEAELVPHL